MADEPEREPKREDKPDDKGGKSRTPADEKRREQILVGAAVVGVILTVILIKRSSANASQQLPVSPAQQPNLSQQAPGSYAGGVSPADFFGLEAQVQGLAGQLSAMSMAPGPVGGVNPPTSSPSNIAAQAAPSGPPADTFNIGQLVNAGSGETIVDRAFSQQYGWLNETNMGGIYQSGGSQPIPGSYLGYVAGKYGVGTPSAQQELALHGQFAGGGLHVTPGGFSETNVHGETYNF